MKFNVKMFVVTITAICAMSTLVYAGGNGFSKKGADSQKQNLSAKAGTVVSLIDQLPLEYLDDGERLELLYMFEEEKVARDVYSALFTVWGHWVFENIAASEQKHMDAIAALFQRYEMTLPESAGTPGVFDSADMQELYNTLVSQGSLSLGEALQVGATIEDLDIFDLKDYVELTDNLDIQTVYENLMRGSRNHLRSFVYQLSLNDLEYTAQYLTQEEIDEILATERERGLAVSNGTQNDGDRSSSRSIGIPQENCILEQPVASDD